MIGQSALCMPNLNEPRNLCIYTGALSIEWLMHDKGKAVPENVELAGYKYVDVQLFDCHYILVPSRAVVIMNFCILGLSQYCDIPNWM